MTNKQYFVKTITYSLTVLILIAVITIVIDPFVHYHAPFFGLAAAETEERGQQIGVAKNMEYDTAIVGSSMSENFEAGWFNDGVIGNKTVKLSMQGAHFDDYSRLLNVVLSKPETKTVIISLDNYLLLHNPSEHPTTIPDYLENDDISDDIYYLWNKSVAFVFLPQFIINNITEGFSADSAYCWAGRYRFDKYVARATYLPYRLIQPDPEEKFDAYYGYANEFLEGVTPYIEARPDVTFIFYSPQSREISVTHEQIEKIPELELMADSEEAGVTIVKTEDSRKFFVTCHAEYDADTLANEYFRDLNKGMEPHIPKNYFPDDDPKKQPVVNWRSTGQLLYTNWLNYYVYQSTPYDVESIGD